ncbi:hypothetical protein SprV_0301296500 [Sparganum proliferum]
MSNRKRAFLISGCVYFVLFECFICGFAFKSERKSYPKRNLTTLRRTYRSLGEVGSSGEVVCEAKGRGTSEFLSCPQKTCRANVDCWVAYGKPQQCVCDPQFCGLVCLPVGARCPPPYRPANGFVSYRDSKVGDTAEYSCAPGFTVMGPRKRHCLGTLQWSGPEPICTNQTDYCFSPPYIQNTIVLEHTKFGEGGSHERNDYRTGDSITMTCRSGFEDPTRKYTTVLCVGNQWKYEKLDCQRISCPEIDGPINGRTIYTSDLRYRATAVQFCNDGHAIKCHDDSEGVVQREEESCTRVCQADGRWSGSNAECTPIQCPQLQKPEHGSLSGFWTKVNSVVAFECEIGYELVGSPFRRCQLDGKWDGDPVVCKIRDCGTPPNIRFAAVKYSSTIFGSKAYFKCESGTVPSVSSSELVCKTHNNKTMWLPFPYPACYRDCSLPVVAQSNISIVRQGGAQDAGGTQPDSDDVLSASSSQTDGLILSNAQAEHGTVIRIACKPGFNLVIDRQKRMAAVEMEGGAVCNDGSWNVSYKCIPARCKLRPPNVANAIVRFYSMGHGSVVRYQCLPGFSLEASKTDPSPGDLLSHAESEEEKMKRDLVWGTQHDLYSVRCEFGEWRGRKPECVPIHCKRPVVMDGVQIHLIGARGRWPFESDSIFPTHGAVVVYSCAQEGYRINGPRYSFCIEGHKRFPHRDFKISIHLLDFGLRRIFPWIFVMADVSTAILGVDFLAT